MATYCEKCGGTLTFDHSIDKLSCKLCLRTFEINEIKMIDDDLMGEILASSKASTLLHVDDGTFSCKIRTCRACGKDMIIRSDNETDTCVYCGNKGLDRTSDRRFKTPSFILPFSITREKAMQIIRRGLTERSIDPVKYLDRNRIDEIRSVYIPCRIVSGEHNNALYVRTSESKPALVPVSQYDHPTLKVWYGIAGRFKFNKMLVPVPTALDKDLCLKLGYSDPIVVDTWEDYLFEADYMDIPALNEELSYAVDQLGDVIFRELASSRVDKYRGIVEGSDPDTKIEYDDGYGLMPAWLFTKKTADGELTFMINAATGKASGVIPTSKKNASKAKMSGKAPLIISIFPAALLFTVLNAFQPFYVLITLITLAILTGIIISYMPKPKQDISPDLRFGALSPDLNIDRESIEFEEDERRDISDSNMKEYFAERRGITYTDTVLKDEDIPDDIPDVNIPLFKPVKGRS